MVGKPITKIHTALNISVRPLDKSMMICDPPTLLLIGVPKGYNHVTTRGKPNNTLHVLTPITTPDISDVKEELVYVGLSGESRE